ncbi:MAG: biotin/lipoyl-containing protein [Gemmatimonadaceae bacterium]
MRHAWTAMRYFVRVGPSEHEVVIDGESITIDGRRVRAHLEDLTGTPQQILSIGDEVHRVLARRGDRRGQYDLSIGGHRFAIEALDDRARAIRELSGVAAAQAGPAHLVAPMPGLIVRVNVQEGDRVRQGQGLVVMEAMKMENELKASAAGIVRRVVVGAGSAVEKGTVLLEMDSGDNA